MSSRYQICNKVGFQIEVVDEIDSTNTYFKDNYMSHNTKSILIALKQTNGRGRFLRKWESNEDLTFSILFKEKYNNAIIAPLSIVMALDSLRIETTIKWPNDIYLNGKKLAGILIEEIFNTDYIASVVGIGINLTDKNFLSSSLSSFNINKEVLLERILYYYDCLIKAPADLLMEMYKNHSLILHRQIKYKNELYVVYDITEEGELVVQGQKGYLTIKCDEIDIKNAIIA